MRKPHQKQQHKPFPNASDEQKNALTERNIAFLQGVAFRKVSVAVHLPVCVAGAAGWQQNCGGGGRGGGGHTGCFGDLL